MRNQAKPTPGKAYHVGHNWHETSVYSDETGQRICTMDTEDWGVNEENQDEYEAIQEANAKLIAEAFTVHSELSLTPRQLAEQRAELWKSLETAIYCEISRRLNVSYANEWRKTRELYAGESWLKWIQDANALLIKANPTSGEAANG